MGFALAGEDDAPGGQNDGNGSQNVNINQTPILGAKLPMRRETLKAIEQARDNLISNPHNDNKDKHRANTRITGDTVERVFTPGTQGLDNQGFDGPSSNTDDEVSTTARNLSNRLHHQPWKGREASS